MTNKRTDEKKLFLLSQSFFVLTLSQDFLLIYLFIFFSSKLNPLFDLVENGRIKMDHLPLQPGLEPLPLLGRRRVVQRVRP